MSDVMTRLHEEHDNIGKLLQALEHQLAIFDSAQQPDYDVLSAIADYFVGFPDRCHHPKEDLIYRKMQEREPALRERLIDLEAEHGRISALEVSRGAFEQLGRHFLSEQRRHMQAEEVHFFPLAKETLTKEDWRAIEAQILQEEDPLFDREAGEEFAVLRDNILSWENEDEALER